MNNRIAIYYHTGAYGTFIEWCLNYFTDQNFNSELPFTPIGNAHKFSSDTTVIASVKMFNEAVNGNSKIIKLHPGVTSPEAKKLITSPKQPINCYRTEIKLLEKYFNKVVVLYFNSENFLWGNNNVVKSFVEESDFAVNYFKKNEVEKYQAAFLKSLTEHIIFRLQDNSKSFAKSWNKNSIEEMENWELREFLSLYIYEEWVDLYQSIELIREEFPNVIFLELAQLRDNFTETITDLFKKLDLKIIERDIQFVYENWNRLQYFKHRDLEIKNIVQAIIDDQELSWPELSIIDEAEIQRQLRNKGWEIKCFNLNTFPRSAKELKSLITKL